MKKVAVLLYPQFSNYEFSVALSIMMQAGKPYDTFALSTDPVLSEEGLRIVPGLSLEALAADDYDALLMTGCLDAEPILNDEKYPEAVARYVRFVRQFCPGQHKIAAISSAPALLAKAGLLGDRKYMVGVPPEAVVSLGFFNPENHVAATADRLFLLDDNILTGVGSGFVGFGIAFGEMLGLDFHPGWYQ